MISSISQSSVVRLGAARFTLAAAQGFIAALRFGAAFDLVALFVMFLPAVSVRFYISEAAVSARPVVRFK